MTMFWLVECPFPGEQGLVGALRTENGTVVLMCDSCGTVWCRPQDIEAENYTQPAAPDWETGCGTHIRPGTTEWADRAQIADAGWGELDWHEI